MTGMAATVSIATVSIAETESLSAKIVSGHCNVKAWALLSCIAQR